MVLDFTMKFAGLPPKLKGKVPATIMRREAMRSINESLVIMRGKMVKVSPFGGTSTLKNSWIIKPAVSAGGITFGSVESSVIQAVVLEDGARRHTPPPGALDVWVRRKLKIQSPARVKEAAFAIGQAISKRGLPLIRSKKKIFSRALKEIAPFVGDIHRRMIDRIIRAFES